MSDETENDPQRHDRDYYNIATAIMGDVHLAKQYFSDSQWLDARFESLSSLYKGDRSAFLRAGIEALEEVRARLWDEVVRFPEKRAALIEGIAEVERQIDGLVLLTNQHQNVIEIVFSPDLSDAQRAGFLNLLGDLFEGAGGKEGLRIVGRHEVRDHVQEYAS